MHPGVEPQQLNAQDPLSLPVGENQPLATDPDPPIQIRTLIQMQNSINLTDPGLDRSLIASSRVASR